jgi:SAM-dependent methyltransferase
MFNALLNINKKPEPYEYLTTAELWTDEYRAKKMLEAHLDNSRIAASRPADFIDKSVAWMIQNFKLDSRSTLLDFGCGPGLYTHRFARHGIEATGVDFSKNSLEYARNRAIQDHLNINYVQQNYLEFETDKTFDLIVMIFCDFCVLSPGQRKIMLDKFRRFLKKDGKIVLDVLSLNSFKRFKEHAYYAFNPNDHFWSPKDHYCFANTFVYDDLRLILEKFTIVENDRTYTICNWRQHYSVDTLQEEFRASNLTLEDIYANVAGTIYQPDTDALEFAVVATK